jgi:hypothetical protein
MDFFDFAKTGFNFPQETFFRESNCCPADAQSLLDQGSLAKSGQLQDDGRKGR